jgi:hypothetical protein
MKKILFLMITFVYFNANAQDHQITRGHSPGEIYISSIWYKPSLTKSYDLLTHFESNLGIGIQGHIENTPCTLIRIGGKNLDKIWLAEGSVLQSRNAANLCRTQALVKLDKAAKLHEMMNPIPWATILFL